MVVGWRWPRRSDYTVSFRTWHLSHQGCALVLVQATERVEVMSPIFLAVAWGPIHRLLQKANATRLGIADSNLDLFWCRHLQRTIPHPCAVLNLTLRHLDTHTIDKHGVLRGHLSPSGKHVAPNERMWTSMHDLKGIKPARSNEVRGGFRGRCLLNESKFRGVEVR